jgi:5,10-methylenetetrahydrofolate reductase
MPAATERRREGCPKRMVHGPCGGALPDGGCELGDRPCVFPTAVGVAGTDVAGTVRPLEQVPLVLADFSAPAFDPVAQQRIAAVLAPSSDAVLVGEHSNRPDFPPTLLAQLLLAAGLRPWITLACRDRNRVVLEQELRGLRHVGVDVVMCVTGDARGYDVRPDATQVFDLDGPRLAALAASLGVRAAVPEAPLAWPTGTRPARLVAKQAAGASVAVLNHVARPAAVAEFVGAARALGLRIPVIAAAAVFTDAGSAAVLSALPGLEVDPAVVDEVLHAADPVEAGIAAAVREAQALLAIEGVEGVNLSGSASSAGWEAAAQIKAEVGSRIRVGARRDP